MNTSIKIKKATLLLLTGVGVALLLWIGSCSKNSSFNSNRWSNETDKNKEIILQWNNLWLEMERNTEGYRPPVAARAFAYTSIAAYEAALYQNFNHKSVYKTLTNNRLIFSEKNQPIVSSLSLNAAYAAMFRNFFPTTKKQSWQKIENLEKYFQNKFSKPEQEQYNTASITFGKNVAEQIWQWSLEDEVGSKGQVQNYELSHTYSKNTGAWKSDEDHPMMALLPNWGNCKTFTVKKEELLVNAPIPYSEDIKSAYYQQLFEVYSLTTPLSKENKWIGEFWSDDVPNLTFTPASRWVSISNQLLEEKPIPSEQMLELYAKLGMALSDAAVVCWNSKYYYNVERPKQYIHKFIDKNWIAPHDNPPFPSYPSGHAMFGSAAKTVLEHYFGNKIEFWDKSHDNRTEFNGKKRFFSSFQEISSENAYSRLALGVHTRQDCEVGMEYGTKIGQKIALLQLRNQNQLANSLKEP